MDIITANTILYCGKWEETVRFYRDYLNLAVNFSTDWFVEFYLSPTTRISIADEKRARVKSSRGKGITLSLEVENIDHAWRDAKQADLHPSAVTQHPSNQDRFCKACYNYNSFSAPEYTSSTFNAVAPWPGCFLGFHFFISSNTGPSWWYSMLPLT